jgi:hypothetical protein
VPTIGSDFLNPHYFTALGDAILNGLCVLLAISLVAGAFTFLTGGTAPRNWPKKEEAPADLPH